MFPRDEQEIIRIRLAESLHAVISQRLLPKKEGKGRVVACEIMLVTGTIRECILDPERTHEIPELIEEGREEEAVPYLTVWHPMAQHGFESSGTLIETLVAFALGLTLFVLTLGLNVLALYIVRKYREQYE